MNTKNHSEWTMLPPGNKAILRFPYRGQLEGICLPSGTSNPRLATITEVIVANQGYPYPWGSLPEATPANTSRLWKEKRIGVGGLIHDRWFLTAEGRIAGAPNVPTTGPGALRHFIYLDGGIDPSGVSDNEGLAVVADVADMRDIYRQIQLHSAERVTADRGAIIISPKDYDNAVVVSFVGRCQTCPNPELISVRALKTACPSINIRLHPDWQEWEV